jgi:hypothetical protein
MYMYSRELCALIGLVGEQTSRAALVREQAKNPMHI